MYTSRKLNITLLMMMKAIKCNHHQKQSCINVKNNYEYFIKWTIIPALTPNIDNSDKPESYHMNSISGTTITLCNGWTLYFNGLEFRLNSNDVRKFENLNPDISINIFVYANTAKSIVGPHYFTMEEKETHINKICC